MRTTLILPHQRTSSRFKIISCCGLIFSLFLVFLAYSPVLNADFFFDDRVYIVENSLITATSGFARIWRGDDMLDYWPLSFSLFRLLWHTAGDGDPLVFHIANILLHCGTSYLLYQVLRMLGLRYAWIAALIFALHPVNCETIAWIFQIRTTLATLLLAASTFAWLAYDRHRRIWIWCAAFLFFTLSLLSKTIAVGFPVLLLVWRRQSLGRFDRRIVLETAPFFVVALLTGMLGLFLQERVRSLTDEFTLDLTSWERAAKIILALAFYVRQAIFPYEIMLIHPQFDQAWRMELVAIAVILCVMLVTAMALHHRRQWRISSTLFWSIAWFCCAILPVLGFVDITFFAYSPVSDHYIYPALPGAIVATLELVWPRLYAFSNKRAVPLFVAVLLVSMFVLTRQQAQIYRDEESIWQDVLVHNPNSWLATYQLGIHNLRRNKKASGLKLLEKTLELNPDYPEALFNLGVYTLELGDSSTAKAFFERALRKKAMPEVLYNLGVMAHHADDLATAERHLRSAIAVRPKFVGARNLLGVVLYRQQRFAEAMAIWRALLADVPDLATAHYNLGVMLAKSGEKEAAQRHLTAALAAPASFNEPFFGVTTVFEHAAAARRLLAALSVGDPQPRPPPN